MNNLNKRMIIGVLTMALSSLAPGVYALTLPHQFSAGNPASSSQVNANFNALNGALPLMWADTGIVNGVTKTNSASVVINTLTANIPANGFVIISGSVSVNNDGPVAMYDLAPLIDNTAVLTYAGAVFGAGADCSGMAEIFCMAYTRTVPITAGVHTFSQSLGPDSTTRNFYNYNSLTALTFRPRKGPLLRASPHIDPG